MRHRITFLKPTGSGINDLGESYPIWETHKTVWAHVAPMTGREYAESQKLRAETTFNITTRYFDGITPDMKISFQNRMFTIISVLNVGEMNTELKIVAAEDLTNPDEDETEEADDGTEE